MQSPQSSVHEPSTGAGVGTGGEPPLPHSDGREYRAVWSTHMPSVGPPFTGHIMFSAVAWPAHLSGLLGFHFVHSQKPKEEYLALKATTFAGAPSAEPKGLAAYKQQMSAFHAVYTSVLDWIYTVLPAGAVTSQQTRPSFWFRGERVTFPPAGEVQMHSLSGAEPPPPPNGVVVVTMRVVVGTMGPPPPPPPPPPSMRTSMQFQNCSPQAVCQNHWIVQVSHCKSAGTETKTSCPPCCKWSGGPWE